MRIDILGKNSALKEIYDTEQSPLNVACTRARNFLLVAGVEPAANFWMI
jgi:hypothetical protein